MLPELTPAVARALEVAHARARGAGARAVEPGHLLHGLLEEDEGRAMAFAAGAGLDPEAYRKGRPEGPAEGPEGQGPLPLHPRTQEALREARALARELFNEPTVSSETILLALLRAEGVLRAELEALGLRFARLEAAVLALRPPPVDLDEPLQIADAVERVDTARIIDAAANRAREGLRVVEDYCRFVLDDAFLSGELKRLRHDLAEALAEFGAAGLLEARETQRDVGTGLSVEGEQERYSPAGVAQANCKRLQEALRSLEEFGKLRGVRLGQALEGLRYRSYTLERALLLGAGARERLRDARLCVLLSGAQCRTGLERTIREALAGGAHMIQLREKGMADRELLARARQVREWTRRAGALFVVNDRPDLARLAEADGVHLGQDDLPVKEARRILGPDALIGVSTHDLEQVRRAVLDGASYLGVGPTFPSGTKAFEHFPGLDFVRRALAETGLPAFVIGGVNLDTVHAAAAAGARRVAVSQAVAGSEDPRSVAAQLVFALQQR